MDTETVIAEEKKDERARYISLVREIERFLSDGLVKERMEIDTLGECGILRHPKKFFTTAVFANFFKPPLKPWVLTLNTITTTNQTTVSFYT